MARVHHYQFAHRVLAHMAQRRGAEVVTKVPADRWTEALTELWDGYGAKLEPEDRLPADGLTGRFLQRDGYNILLVTLPRPEQPPEAHFVAFVVPPQSQDCRFYTLEHSVDPIGEQPYTVIAQWRDGSHINLGPGPAPDAEAFVTEVVQRAGVSAQDRNGDGFELR